jgi:hypothetical protein
MKDDIEEFIQGMRINYERFVLLEGFLVNKYRANMFLYDLLSSPPFAVEQSLSITKILNKLVGFGRACAPVRCAYLSFGLINTRNGALRAPPAHRSFAASYLSPKALPQARNRSARDVYLSIGLSCTLRS